jgi:hypothetical protein
MAFVVTTNYPRAPNISLFAQSTYGFAPLSGWTPHLPNFWPIVQLKKFVTGSTQPAITPNGTNMIPFKPLPAGSGAGGGGPVGYPIDSG